MKFFLPIFLVLLFSSDAIAVVAHSSTATHAGTGVTELSFNCTTAGSNRGVIGTAHYTAADAGRSITTFVFNSVGLTLIDTEMAPIDGYAVEMWKTTTQPAATTATAVATLTGGSADMVATCTSYTGVNTTNLVGTSASSSTVTDTTLTQDVTVAADGAAQDAYIHSFGTFGGTAGGGQSEIFDLNVANIAAYGSVSTTSGTNTMSYSWTDSVRAASIAVPINATAAAPSGRRRAVVVD
jgi:hypothetical protein